VSVCACGVRAPPAMAQGEARLGVCVSILGGALTSRLRRVKSSGEQAAQVPSAAPWSSVRGSTAAFAHRALGGAEAAAATTAALVEVGGLRVEVLMVGHAATAAA